MNLYAKKVNMIAVKNLKFKIIYLQTGIKNHYRKYLTDKNLLKYFVRLKMKFQIFIETKNITLIIII
jgi:hypothetical protein